MKSLNRVHTAILIATVAFLGACSDDASEDSPNGQTGTDAGMDVQAEANPQQDAQPEAEPDTALPACPDEVDLTTVDLPCDCYGNIATDPTTQVPGCQSQVVCCPSTQNLRCEDHEQDAAADAPDEADAEPVQACPIEKDLTTVELPCDCYGNIVEDPAVSMPDCELTVVCCPGIKDLKCE